MAKLSSLKALKILDGNGRWTFEIVAKIDNHIFIKASLPSFEDDSFSNSKTAAENFVKILNQLILPKITKIKLDKNFFKNSEKLLVFLINDKKKKINKKITLLVSIVCFKIASFLNKTEDYKYLKTYFNFRNKKTLPTPIFNLFNGGKYGDTNLDFEEFLLIPRAKKSFKEILEMSTKVFHNLGEVLKEAGLDTDIGSEGGYAPDVVSSIQVLEFILASITKSGFSYKKDFALGINIGSNQIYDENSKKYLFKLDQNYFILENLLELYREWLSRYPIIYLEDVISEKDLVNWENLMKNLGDRILISGDKLYNKNLGDFKLLTKKYLSNTITLRLSNFQTISELSEAVKFAKSYNYKLVLAGDFGETNDDFLADIAIAFNFDFIKAGSLTRGERNGKYNRMIEINI